MAPTTVAQTLKNKKNAARYMEIFDMCNITEAPKETGALISTVISKVKEQLAVYTKDCIERVTSKKWLKSNQIDAGIAFLEGKVHSVGEGFKIDDAEFDKASGVGIVITEEQIQAEIDSYCTANEAEIKRLGHGYNWPVAIKAIKDKLMWADGASMQKLVTSTKLALCGPVPEKDGKRAKVGKLSGDQKAKAK